MGDLNVRLISSQKELNTFTSNLLRDLKALEYMLGNGLFPDDDPIHVGAEQEICLIDKHLKPAPVSLQIMETLKNDKFTTELAKFNIEANLDPRTFEGSCFSDMEKEILHVLNDLKIASDKWDTDYALTGILPTIRKFDLEIENLTPYERYFALVKAITKLRGKVYELKISGLDELNIKHDSAMLEACNTSFQVHLQVHPKDFVSKYNAAQVFAAPVLAIASNSPLLFGKRLWHETRVALFQQSIDTRITSEHLRDRSPRVTFGNAWLQDSILELYKEDIVRFRVMLMTDSDVDPLEELERGIIPKLKALTIHNSTVYRWNRPCYGISADGRPHLRIENRVLPSGPTPLDEVSNAAFWLGLMSGFEKEYGNFSETMEFDDVKTNFVSAAFSGVDSKLKWNAGKKIPVSELILDELLPVAKKGLENQNIDEQDINKYLGVIKDRAESRQTGTVWMLNSFAKLSKETTRDEATMALTSSMVKQQQQNIPVHKWDSASMEDVMSWHPGAILVEEFMTTDLFTVHKNDILEFVAEIMDWKKLRYIPVEDEKANITGLVTSRMLLRSLSNNSTLKGTIVSDIMIKDPICIAPEATIHEAMNILKKNKIGCLPVVKNKKLIGIVTENNFLHITDSLLKIISKKDN